MHPPVMPRCLAAVRRFLHLPSPRPAGRPRVPACSRLVGRNAVVLDACGDFGHVVLDGRLRLVRHRHEVLRPGQSVHVVEQLPDLLMVETDADAGGSR